MNLKIGLGMIIFFWLIFCGLIYRYEERKWVQKGATQPTTKAVQINNNVSKFLEGLKRGIPRKTRTLSLEEEILTKHIAQIAPPPTVGRSRGVMTMVLLANSLYFFTNEAIAGCFIMVCEETSLHRCRKSVEDKVLGSCSSWLDIPSMYCLYVLYPFMNIAALLTRWTFSMQGSLDMNEKAAAPIPPRVPPSVAEVQVPTNNKNGTTDLYTLLYVNNVQQEYTIAPPSRWATFDCKTQTSYYTCFIWFFFFKWNQENIAVIQFKFHKICMVVYTDKMKNHLECK